MAYIGLVIVYVALLHCDFRVCLVFDSRQNTMISYEQANVNADCSVGLISTAEFLSLCIYSIKNE